MEITKDVIMDLLPLYLDGEASADTVKLIEAHLAQDPGLKSLLAEMANPSAPFDAAFDTHNNEKEVVMKTKKILRTQSILLGFGLFFSAMPLLTVGNSTDGITWTMIQEMPALAFIFGSCALFTWGLYAWNYRRYSD